MAKVRNAILAVVLLATGVYFVLYLYGWEWYRAFMAGVIFLAAEVAAVGLHVGSVVRDSSQGQPSPVRRVGGSGERVVADVLKATDPAHYDTFRWLRPREGQLPVFIPLLLGAGVVMSGVAWVMERVAGSLYGDRIDDAVIKVAAPLIPTDNLLDIPTHAALLTAPGRWDDWSDVARPDGQGPARPAR